MVISTEDIRNAYELPLATNIEVRSHTFNEKDLWAVIRNEAQYDNKVVLKGKKKDLLKPILSEPWIMFTSVCGVGSPVWMM